MLLLEADLVNAHVARVLEDRTMESRIKVDGAELAVTTWGNGAPILSLPGGCGSALSCQALHQELADAYQLIAFDRRGHFRSTGRVDAPMQIARLADDAAAVIEQIAREPVLVISTSAGAVVALDLLTRHTRLVKGVIAHEPPVLHVLPDADAWLPRAEALVALARGGDVDDAYRRLGVMVGLADAANAPPLPAESRSEWEYLFRCEWPQLFTYQPDRTTLAEMRERLVMANGAEHPDCVQARTARVLAEAIGARHVVFPGNHLAPVLRPHETATALAPLLAALSA